MLIFSRTARITVQKYALGASFRVCIFLVPDGQNNSIISETDASGWPSSPYYVGSMCAFVNGTHLPACDNCVEQQENNLVIEGYVPLDEAIVEKSGLSSFAHEEVHDYLQRNLVWRCQKVSILSFRREGMSRRSPYSLTCMPESD